MKSHILAIGCLDPLMTRKEIVGPLRRQFVFKLIRYINQKNKEDLEEYEITEDKEYQIINVMDMVSQCVTVERDSINRWKREAIKRNRIQCFRLFDSFLISVLCSESRAEFLTMMYWAGQDPKLINKKYPKLMDKMVSLINEKDIYIVKEALEEEFRKNGISKKVSTI